MPQTRIVLFFILFLSCYGNSVIAQPDFNNLRIVKQAEKNFRETHFEQSLIISREALKRASDAEDDYLIARSYKIIADNYNELGEFDKTIFFYKKSVQYADRIDNDTLKCKVYNNLGNVYCFEKKQYKEGIDYYKKSIIYCSKIKDFSQIYFTTVNLAWAYFDIANFTQGLPYLKFLNKNREKYGSESTDIIIEMLNGMYFSSKKEILSAEKHFLKAIQLGKNSNEKSDLSYAHQEYSKFLTTVGRYQEAYTNLHEFNILNKDLYNEEKLDKASIAGFNLELDEYKRQIDKIENEKDLQYQSLRKSRIIVLLLILISFVFLILIITLFKNINFKKKNNIELFRAKEIAEEASVLKTQFISTISHELRTPLYGVVGITNLLLDEHKELSKSEHLNSLKFSARYLLSLVNDILQINKIEENKVKLENLTFNISDEINMVKKALSFLSNNNNNTILVDIDDNIPEYLIGDKLRLSQILMNLMGNALKFTKNGEVVVTVNLVKIEGALYFIEFNIKDNGIGIAIEDQNKIFDKFIQVGRKNDDYQGTGLGLTIVKRLLGLFGSTIEIKSEIGQGTIFTFTIAFEFNLEKTKKLINDMQVDLTSDQVYKVLVVEDNRINQIVTKKIIENNNYTCKVVDDGFAALDILEIEHFDIILMDINMPLMNGFETTRKIRLRGINTPIVALTAFNKDEITEEAISSGINDIIIKPFEHVKLFKIINCLIVETKSVGC